MFCLAGIAGKVESIETNTRAADRLLVLDGCDSDCRKKTMELAGYSEILHFQVSDLGWEKGKTPVSEERVAVVAQKLRDLLRNGGVA
jgi:uncharacterized metal-binding protein